MEELALRVIIKDKIASPVDPQQLVHYEMKVSKC
jgi:hypothetical protein